MVLHPAVPGARHPVSNGLREVFKRLEAALQQAIYRGQLLEPDDQCDGLQEGAPVHAFEPHNVLHRVHHRGLGKVKTHVGLLPGEGRVEEHARVLEELRPAREPHQPQVLHLLGAVRPKDVLQFTLPLAQNLVRVFNVKVPLAPLVPKVDGQKILPVHGYEVLVARAVGRQRLLHLLHKHVHRPRHALVQFLGHLGEPCLGQADDDLKPLGAVEGVQRVQIVLVGSGHFKVGRFENGIDDSLIASFSLFCPDAAHVHKRGEAQPVHVAALGGNGV
mmetsp:Transcript_50202/g.113948  ORF Transcript_50202/g.113948 Transcript_50202/m.113948 type:complete len:275 (-) Transcript_50202:740-1564(-)